MRDDLPVTSACVFVGCNQKRRVVAETLGSDESGRKSPRGPGPTMSRPSNGAALSAAAAVSVAVVLAAIIRRSQQSARLRRHRRWVYRAGFQSLHREMDAAVRLAVTCGEAMLATPRASTSFKDSKNGKGGIDPQTATDVDNERLVMDTLKAEFPEVRVRLLMSGAFHRVCSVCSCARVRTHVWMWC